MCMDNKDGCLATGGRGGEGKGGGGRGGEGKGLFEVFKESILHNGIVKKYL